MEGMDENWSEAVEDLIEAGDTEKAIVLLESLVSRLETQNSSSDEYPKLAAALNELAKLYSSKGFSLKADELRSRAPSIRQGANHVLSSGNLEVANKNYEGRLSNDAPHCNDLNADGSINDGYLERSSKSSGDAIPCNGSLDDDWEIIADRAPNELLSPQCLPEVSELSLEDAKVQGPKRRGRGTFSYAKQKLYSDLMSAESVSNDSEDGQASDDSRGTTKSHLSELSLEDAKVQGPIQRERGTFSYTKQKIYSDLMSAESVSNDPEDGQASDDSRGTTKSHSRYGPRHVLVLADFSPSTRTTELEKLFEDFKDRGVVIRWVNDTVALAVFRTPSMALEASKKVQCPFSVRVLDEDDIILSSISPKDLEPPRQRPQTSARTARRLIAQGMGIKLPSTTFGSNELKKQEEARKQRIVTRQNLRDDAWGGDDVN